MNRLLAELHQAIADVAARRDEARFDLKRLLPKMDSPEAFRRAVPALRARAEALRLYAAALDKVCAIVERLSKQ